MGINFRKSFKVAPGVKINVGKTGVSTSIGTRGAVVNVGKRGTRATVGIPGTGLSYSQKLGGKSKQHNAEFVEEPKSSEEIIAENEAQIKENIEQIKTSMERGKKLYTWDNMKSLLWNIIILPLIAFLGVGLLFTPVVGILVAVVALAYGCYKFLNKTKNI